MTDQVMCSEKMTDEVMSSEEPPIQKKRMTLAIKPPRHEWSLVPESKLVLIIRTGGEDKSMLPHNRKLLCSMGLQKLNTAVFVKADEALMATLRKLKRFVIYKYPSPEDAKKIIYTCGAVKLDKKVTKLNRGNDVVEQAFGRYNIHCIEEVANEIANVGSHFKDVSAILHPFRVPSIGTPTEKITLLISNLKI